VSTAEPDGIYEDICSFCAEVVGTAEPNLFYDLGLATSRQQYVLRESEHFIVVPCIGALTDWYVLIVSRRHALSVGWLDDEESADLRSLITETQAWLGDVSGQNVLIFEHGSLDFRDKGGACYDHAHIHLVAAENGLAEFLPHIPPPVSLRPCPDWVDAARDTVHAGRSSYLALQADDTHMIAPATGAPSQFFRRCLATWLGAELGEWDWLVYPQNQRVLAMMRHAPRAD
jgi:diadenosine tetraphosphate (Ap4A) HIT family hydrolase